MKRNNVVVSRKAVESENSEERDELISNLKRFGKSMLKILQIMGHFRPGGVDGLLHITDMAWKKVNILSL